MDPVGRLEAGTYPLRPDPDPGSGDSARKGDLAPDGPRPLPAAPRPERPWLERASRTARRRGRFTLSVLGGLAALDAVIAASWVVAYRAQATVLVDPARSLEADARAHLPAISERLQVLIARATTDVSLEGELEGESPELARAHWLDDALDPHASARSPVDCLRERIAVAVEGPERSLAIRISVRGERPSEVALVASRIAARLVALDEAFRADDARAHREGAARDKELGTEPLARAEAELTAFRKASPRASVETEASMRAQLADLEARATQDASQEAELASTFPLLEAEESQRHAALLDEADAARRGAGGHAPDASRAAGESTDRFVLGAAGYPAWRDAHVRVEAARTQLKTVRAHATALAPELARARDLARDWPELHARLARLEAERDRAAASLAAARHRLEAAERLASIELGTATDGARVERLVLADPPCRLEPPDGPGRSVVFLVGLVLSALAALAAGLWRELRDHSIHTSEDAVRSLGLPVLGVVPRLPGRR